MTLASLVDPHEIDLPNATMRHAIQTSTEVELSEAETDEGLYQTHDRTQRRLRRIEIISEMQLVVKPENSLLAMRREDQKL
jgi:hypothetical protein